MLPGFSSFGECSQSIIRLGLNAPEVESPASGSEDEAVNEISTLLRSS
jgi:hypothetical protein